jgi:hypothetical protein
MTIMNAWNSRVVNNILLIYHWHEGCDEMRLLNRYISIRQLNSCVPLEKEMRVILLRWIANPIRKLAGKRITLITL